MQTAPPSSTNGSVWGWAVPEQTAIAQFKRQILPPEQPRDQISHESHFTISTYCQMQRIGECIIEKLDNNLGMLSVEQHTGGKWAASLEQEPKRKTGAEVHRTNI